MRQRTLRAWSWVHKWSSLVSTGFLLLLCITGLPLIFYEEIDHLAGQAIEAPALPADTPRAPMDAVVAAAQAHFPGKVPLYVFAEPEAPDLYYVKLDTRVDTDEREAVFAAVDARTAQVLGQPVFNAGVMNVFFRLHVDLFADEPGRLFLGVMGVLMVLALVSGVVLYAPFMRKLDFGTVRAGRDASLRWLDLHNLIGIVTLVWACAVGLTGVINTLANQILKSWQAGQVAALQAAHRHDAVEPVLPSSTPLQRAVSAALAAHPERQLSQIAFPGTLLSTPQHYTVLLAGNTPLTARLQDPVLVAPSSGRLIEAPPRPGLVTALQVSQPLHFGDYGGLPLKLLWALLDLATVVVLWSGLVLWWRKHRRTASAGTHAARSNALKREAT